MFKRQQKRAYKISKNASLKVPKKLVPFVSYLGQRTKAGVANIKKLYLEIKQQGYQGCYMSLYRFLRTSVKNPQNLKRSQRLETGPGEQAQVDWGSFGEIEINGATKRLYCFVYILGYSRALYVEFTTRQNIQSLLECHIHAFEQLGIPQTIVYDNMKTVVLRREKLENGEVKNHYNPAFLDFANFYGFDIFVCPPYWPRAKGKVEASVKFVRNNFMQGMSFKKDFFSLEELNEKASFWLSQVANTRDHRITGERPIDRWLIEKAHLRFPSKQQRYQTSHFEVRNSTKDGMVQYHSNYYSVPAEFASKKLFLEEVNNLGVPFIKIYHEDKVIAKHIISRGRNEWIVSDEHIINSPQQPKNAEKQFSVQVGNLEKYSVEVKIRPLSYYNQFIPHNIPQNKHGKVES